MRVRARPGAHALALQGDAVFDPISYLIQMVAAKDRMSFNVHLSLPARQQSAATLSSLPQPSLTRASFHLPFFLSPATPPSPSPETQRMRGSGVWSGW